MSGGLIAETCRDRAYSGDASRQSTYDVANNPLSIELKDKYNFLYCKGLEMHARDFAQLHTIRQQKTDIQDPVLDEHNAICSYMQLHDSQGVRLPLHWRGSSTALENEFTKFI